MVQRSEIKIARRCYGLCVGIGTYPNLTNRNLRYAEADATIIADRLADPQRGNFAVTVLNEPGRTTKDALDEAVTHMLSAPDRRAEDLALLYFSCHGALDQTDHTFCLLPSNASLQEERRYDPTALIGITDFARWFANATVQNIVVLLDVCHSGGAGAALQQFTVKLDAGPNFFFIGAARLDQVAMQSSRLQHGLFTHCLLRAFEQPPTSDGWLTVSQIHTFISDELPWFTKEHPIQIQSWSVSVNPNVPLVRNPGYPELAPLPPVWNVPLQRNTVFTGQEELLSQLACMLQGTQKTALTHPHALSGLGGIGKTQLALEYAYQHRQDYHAVLWGRAESTEALISSFLEIAQVLDLPRKNEPDQSIIVEAVKIWLSHRPHWLFILDNANDVGLVQAFLPPTFRGHLLLTTRAQAMGKIVESKLEVEAMRPEIGALLLLRRARIVSKETTLEEAPVEAVTQAKALAEELGGLPLALDQAGAYIEATQCSLADYQQQYQTRRAELLALRNGPKALPGAWKDDHPESVATTWSLSFAKVEATNPTAAELLCICAFLAPDDIPEELLLEALEMLLSDKERPKQQRKRGDRFSPISRGYLDEAVAMLREYSLIQRSSTNSSLIIHRLVQTILKAQMTDMNRHSWIERIVCAVNRAFPLIDRRNKPNWSWCERLLPHVLMCIELIENQALASKEVVNLLEKTAHYWFSQGQYKQAELIFQCLIAIDETFADDPLLAGIYTNLGKYAEAELIFQRAIDTHDPDDFLIVNRLHDLADHYVIQGKYEQAEALYQQARDWDLSFFGYERPYFAMSLTALGRLYATQGKYGQAEALFREALSWREGDGDTSNAAWNLKSLADLSTTQGKYEQAEILYQRAIAQFGRESYDIVPMFNALANLYTIQNKYEQAEVLYWRVLAIDEKALGPTHPDIVTTLEHLAMLYKTQGKYKQAEPLLQRALTICEQRLGAAHPTTSTIQANYTALLEAMKHGGSRK